MAHEPDWHDIAVRLRKLPDIEIVQFEIGDAITDDDRQMVKLLAGTDLPVKVMATLAYANGVKLVWKGKVAGKSAQGSVNIIPFVQAALRAGVSEDSKPLEGVLWDDEFDPAVKAVLTEMVIFEALAGRSAHLVYRAGDNTAQLHLIDNDTITALVTDFDKSIEIIAQYGGADGVREHLCHTDWARRITADKQLVALANP